MDLVSEREIRLCGLGPVIHIFARAKEWKIGGKGKFSHISSILKSLWGLRYVTFVARLICIYAKTCQDSQKRLKQIRGMRFPTLTVQTSPFPKTNIAHNPKSSVTPGHTERSCSKKSKFVEKTVIVGFTTSGEG